ncbi:MAG: hypothetical protein ATN35_06685 [Epulopiscium sp. Nele67-Bin004]|nr:MAG: hypothetical protein ATN35_06685 [Epulopiscium sp. Nele67-Bin004]
MRSSEIKIGHIYFVNFDPVEEFEFNNKHLAVVLKKNVDKRTFIVMPLTSSDRGEGINKIRLDNVIGLPSNLRNKKTYAVYNQVRTLNANRFSNLKEKDKTVKAKIDDKDRVILYEMSIKELLAGVDIDFRIKIMKNLYQQEVVNKSIQLAYNILRCQKANEPYVSYEKEIKLLLKDISYTLSQKDIDNGVDKILIDALQN